MTRDEVWDFCTGSLLFFLSLFLFLNWSRFPVFMDCYYHLSVMQGFADAGGWVGHAFWEYAPAGRPHLYPPLFHILELAGYSCGLSLITIARLSQIAIYPFFLITCWHVTKRLFSSRLAFFVVFASAASLPLYLSVITLVPFTIALMLGILSFHYFEKEKPLAAFLCLALSFYAHDLMAWIALLSLAAYGLCTRRNSGHIFFVAGGSILAGLPLMLHQARFSALVHAPRVLEFYYAHVNLLLCALAIGGAWICIRRRGRHLFFPIFLGGMALLLFFYRNRFWSGQGLLPFVFLSGILLEKIYAYISERKRRGLSRSLFWVVSFALFYIFTPTLEFIPFQKAPVFFWGPRWSRPQEDVTGMSRVFVSEETFYYPRYVDEVVRLIRENSSERDIIYSSFNYAGGMFAALAHRATSDAMLPEVGATEETDKIMAARLVLWFKELDGSLPKEGAAIASRYGLKQIADTEIISLFLNERATAQKRVVRAGIPRDLCFISLFFVFVLLWAEERGVWDRMRHGAGHA